MTMDIKVFHLNTPTARYKYMQLRIADMPNYVIKNYQLTDLATAVGLLAPSQRYSTIEGEEAC
jgi:hypothetical protein